MSKSFSVKSSHEFVATTTMTEPVSEYQKKYSLDNQLKNNGKLPQYAVKPAKQMQPSKGSSQGMSMHTTNTSLEDFY